MRKRSIFLIVLLVVSCFGAVVWGVALIRDSKNPKIQVVFDPPQELKANDRIDLIVVSDCTKNLALEFGGTHYCRTITVKMVVEKPETGRWIDNFHKAGEIKPLSPIYELPEGLEEVK